MKGDGQTKAITLPSKKLLVMSLVTTSSFKNSIGNNIAKVCSKSVQCPSKAIETGFELKGLGFFFPFFGGRE